MDGWRARTGLVEANADADVDRMQAGEAKVGRVIP